MSADTAGPVIVWENYGCEGWHPKSYPGLKAALTAQRFNSQFVVTKLAEFEVVENSTPFECGYCRERDVLVSGPHSHVCANCGDRAIGGWYTTPWCEKCKQIVLAKDGNAWPRNSAAAAI